VARSLRAGSYGNRHTVIITWFRARKPRVSLTHIIKDVMDDDGLKVFKALSCFEEEEDANKCRIVMGDNEKLLHRQSNRSNVSKIVSARGENFPPKRSTTLSLN